MMSELKVNSIMQQQNKPVLTMRMILFLCTSMMMSSPVVVEGAHTVRVAALSEATTATNTKTMMMKRRSVQDIGVRVSSESGVRNFIDINNNDANQQSPQDDHENHDDHNDHTFTFTELYNDNYDSNRTPIIADTNNNIVKPTIMNYNDLNNDNDAAVDESSEVVMNYNNLTNADAAAVGDAATVDIVTTIMKYNDLNNDVVADESSEVVMNYNDLTNADAAAAVDATVIDIVTPIMNYNDLSATAAADDAPLLELLTPTMAPPQENIVIIGRASTAKSSCACRNTDTTDVIRARINNGEKRPPCKETGLNLEVEMEAEVEVVEVEVEVVEVAGMELEVVKVEVEVASEGEGEEDLLGVNIISLGEYDSLYGTTNDNEKTTDTAVIVDDETTDTVIVDASRSSVDDESTKQRDPMVITTICFGILILFLLLLLVCNYRCWKLQKQREQEELCGQYVFDIPDNSNSENDDDDSAVVLKDGEMEYPIHKIVVGSNSEEEDSGKFGIRRKLSRLVEYVVSIKTTRNGQTDILTDVHRCTSAFCPVCEKQRKAVMSCESYDIKISGQQQQEVAIPKDDDEGEEEEEHGSVIYVPRGDEEMGVGGSTPSFYVYETDNDNDEIETRHERHTVFQSPTKIPLLPPPVPVRRPTGTSSRSRSRTATAKPSREPVPTTVRRPRSRNKATPRREP